MIKNRLILVVVALLSNLPQARANVLGSVETFSVDPTTLSFFTVHGSRTLRPGWMNLGVFGSYAEDNYLVYENQPNPFAANYQRRYYFEDQAFYYEFVAAIGVLDRIEITTNVAGLMSQDFRSNQLVTADINSGVHSVRPGIKYNFLRAGAHGMAVAASIDFPMSDTDVYFGNKQEPIYNLEAIYDVEVGPALVGANVGYRLRNPGVPTAPTVFPLDDQITASLGTTIPVQDRVAVTGELIGSLPADKGQYNSSQDISSLEVLGAVRFSPVKNLFLHGGGSFETFDGGFSPTFRVFAGLNYLFNLFGQSESTSDLDTSALEDLAIDLKLSPRKIRLAPGEEHEFVAAGGQPPYRYVIVSGPGMIDEEIGFYTADMVSGTTQVRVTDATGKSAESTVVVDEIPVKAGEIALAPASALLLEGSRQKFAARGGVAPYTYSVKGAGRVDQAGMYTSPFKPSNDTLIVTDANGKQATANIEIRAIPKPTKTFVLNNLRFKFNSDQLEPGSIALLNDALKNLKMIKINSMIIEGHTDSVGKADYNQDLSIRRAEAIRKIMIKSLKLQPSTVKAVGFGEERPRVRERTAKDRAQNRRVELKLYGNQRSVSSEEPSVNSEPEVIDINL